MYSLGILYFIWQLYLFGSVPDTILSALHVPGLNSHESYVVLLLPHFTDEETKIQRG